MIARNGRVGGHQETSPTSQHWCLPLQIYKQRSWVRAWRRKTRRHVTILSRLGTVASLIGRKILILSFWLAVQSVWTNETLPRLPVGHTPLAAVSLLHNTLAWEAVWAARKISSSICWAIYQPDVISSQGHYDLLQFWQMTSGCCMRLESETCAPFVQSLCFWNVF